LGEIGADLEGKGGSVGRLGQQLGHGWSLKKDPTCGPHMSVAEGRRGGSAWAGPTWAGSAARGREELGRIRPNGLKEGF
jgi:hypothetical protein